MGIENGIVIARRFFAFMLVLPFASCGQNRAVISNTVLYPIGNDTISITITDYGGSQQPVYVNVHDNESNAIEAALPILEEHGGVLVKLNNKSERLITFQLDGKDYTFDPNRIFSHNGIVHTLIRNKRISNKAIAELENFATFFLEQLPDSKLIVALHNNSDEGPLSIESFLDDGEHSTDAEAVNKTNKDPDDFFLTTDRELYERLTPTFNIVLQDTRKVKQDGSLSVYFGEKGIPYLNCETQYGHVAEGRQMMEAIPPLLELF